MRVTATTPDSATLSWDALGSDATQYVIEKVDANDALIDVIAVDGSTGEATVGALASGSEYKLRIFAENEAGRSELPVVIPVVGTPTEALVTGIYQLTVAIHNFRATSASRVLTRIDYI